MEEAALGARGLGLGLAAVGRPAYINLGHGADLAGETSVEALRRRAHDVLDAAYAGGIRYVDAARSYGLAEEFLAGWLAERGIAPGEIEVGSKWGYTYTGGWRLDADEHEVKDLSVGTLRRQVEETREHLGPHLRLLQIHSATVESGVLEDSAVLHELAQLRATGVRVGLTVTGPGQRATIEQALATGEFDTVQATWNLLERSAESALAAAHRAGLVVIVKEAVANGRLAVRDGVEAVAAAARERETTADALALAAALARPWAGIVLSGASSVSMLRSNLTAREVAWDDELEQELAGLAEDADSYWSARSRLAWT